MLPAENLRAANRHGTDSLEAWSAAFPALMLPRGLTAEALLRKDLRSVWQWTKQDWHHLCSGDGQTWQILKLYLNFFLYTCT